MHITLQEKIFRKISINPIEFTIHHVYSNELIALAGVELSVNLIL